jgi:hypothetical protein
MYLEKIEDAYFGHSSAKSSLWCTIHTGGDECTYEGNEHTRVKARSMNLLTSIRSAIDGNFGGANVLMLNKILPETAEIYLDVHKSS